MKNIELKQRLAILSNQLFNEKGFKSIIDREGFDFKKKTAFGENRFSCVVIGDIEIFRVSCFVDIYFRKVMRVFHEVERTEAKTRKNVPSTLHYTHSNYLGKVTYRYKIVTEDDIHIWFNDAQKFMNEFGFHVFETYDSLEKIDTLINSDLSAPVPLVSSMFMRATQGIIIARLLGRPNVEHLVEQYRGLVKNVYGWEVERYAKHAQFILNHSTEQLNQIAESKYNF